MAVALDHLRSDRRGLQAQARADGLFHFGREVCEVADGARGLTHAQVLGSGRDAGDVATTLLVPDSNFQPEGDGLGVYAVCAADLDRVAELQRTALQNLSQRLEVPQDNPRGL